MTTTMNIYDRVVIAYDKNLENFQMATAIRGMLECYGLNVSLVWLNEKRNAIDFLAGHIPRLITQSYVLTALGRESYLADGC